MLKPNLLALAVASVLASGAVYAADADSGTAEYLQKSAPAQPDGTSDAADQTTTPGGDQPAAKPTDDSTVNLNEIKVTGSDRTLVAIQRMVPDHAREIDGSYGWTVRITPLLDGVELTVTVNNPTEVQKIRALGFIGIMVQGSHHQIHHFAMAKGEPVHMH